MDGVGTPIIERPRPLPGHDTPNPAYHPHTLNYEEPDMPVVAAQILTFRPFPIKPHEIFIGKGRFCLCLYVVTAFR